MLESSAGSDGQAGSFDEVTVRPLEHPVREWLNTSHQHIIVDEVHERSIDCKLVVGFHQ